MDRRQFLAAGAAAAAVAALPRRGRADELMSRPGEVVQVFRPGVTDGRDVVHPEAARALLDDALRRFGGKDDPADVLAEYVDPADTVGLKVNALAAPGHPFHPVFAWRLVDHLRALGVPDDRIIIYDQYGDRMQKSGYRLQRSAKRGVRVVNHRSVGYRTREVDFDRVRALRWTRVLDEVTAIINLCVPKDHDLAGVTGALKNMAFGNIDRVPEFHQVIHEAIVWMYAQPEILGRTRLTICDATRVLYEGGPQDQPRHRVPYDAMLVSEDPVAMDWAILDIVNAHRADHGLQPVEHAPNARGKARPPDFLPLAVAGGLGQPLERLKWTRVYADGSVAPYHADFIDRAWSDRPPAGAGSRPGRPAPDR